MTLEIILLSTSILLGFILLILLLISTSKKSKAVRGKVKRDIEKIKEQINGDSD